MSTATILLSTLSIKSLFLPQPGPGNTYWFVHPPILIRESEENYYIKPCDLSYQIFYASIPKKKNQIIDVYTKKSNDFIAPDKWVIQILFLFHHKNIFCGYPLEASRWGASNEYPQHTFFWRNKKNMNIFHLKKVPYLELCAFLLLQPSKSLVLTRRYW